VHRHHARLAPGEVGVDAKGEFSQSGRRARRGWRRAPRRRTA
jgi:hypothetical protein